MKTEWNVKKTLNKRPRGHIVHLSNIGYNYIKQLDIAICSIAVLDKNVL